MFLGRRFSISGSSSGNKQEILGWDDPMHELWLTSPRAATLRCAFCSLTWYTESDFFSGKTATFTDSNFRNVVELKIKSFFWIMFFRNKNYHLQKKKIIKKPLIKDFTTIFPPLLFPKRASSKLIPALWRAWSGLRARNKHSQQWAGKSSTRVGVWQLPKVPPPFGNTLKASEMDTLWCVNKSCRLV